MKVAALIPAYQAATSIAGVVSEFVALAAQNEQPVPLWVVDDGSTDGTSDQARRAGARVLRHEYNQGKGAALLTGFEAIAQRGFEAVVTFDADAQHPPEEAMRLALLPLAPERLILGIRDLARDGAPKNSQFSNSISNYFLSRFAGMHLADTQCGLRRYPLPQTLELRPASPGYALEAEIILRAARAGWVIDQIPVRVVYPPQDQRISHFHVVRDPTRIVFRVIQTWLDLDDR